MNETASRVNTSAMSSSTHRAVLPPAMYPIRLMPLDDRLVVAVARLHLEQARVFLAGRLVADRGTVTDPDRVARVETDDVMAPDEDAGHTVAGRRHDEGLVEADFQGARLDHRRSSRSRRLRARDAICRRSPSRSPPA